MLLCFSRGCLCVGSWPLCNPSHTLTLSLLFCSVSSVTCLDSSLREALVTKRGLRELYSHQVLALEALLSQGALTLLKCYA
jgi:hypothetical protein